MSVGQIAVVGVPWSGSRTLVRAVSTVDPSLVCTVGVPDEAVGRAGDRFANTPGTTTVGMVLLDPASIAGKDELALLERMAAVTGHVALVVTKVDAFWDWPTIARASRAELDPSARLPVFAVSAAAALAGAVDESGVEDLVEWIRERLADGPSPPVDIDSAAPPLDSAAEMMARRTRVLRQRERGRADRLAALRAGLTAIRSDVSAQLATGLRDINDVATTSVSRLSRSGVDAHERWLADAVNALRESIDTEVRRRLDRLRTSVLLDIEPPDGPPPAPVTAPLSLRTPPLRRHGGEDIAWLAAGASAGFSVGRFVVWPLAEVDALRWLGLPAGLVVGLVVAGSIIAVRRSMTLRSQVRVWTVDALTEARGAIEQEVASAIAATDPAISGRVVRHYERRGRAVAEQVAEIDAALRSPRGRTDPARAHGTGPARVDGTGSVRVTSNVGRPWAPTGRSDPTPMERT